MKISRAFVHRYLISNSCSWTCFPGRFPRTDGRRRENEREKREREASAPGYTQRRGAKQGVVTFEQPVNDRVEIDLLRLFGHSVRRDRGRDLDRLR
jgi:hypothetical protein